MDTPPPHPLPEPPTPQLKGLKAPKDLPPHMTGTRYSFAHLADLHIGGWRDEKLKQLGLEALTRAIDTIIERRVDFVIIAGDLFNTAVPSIDAISHTTHELSRLRNENIPVYHIMGSHDYSASGKTMLDVLEKAGLTMSVEHMRYTGKGTLVLDPIRDEKTGIMLVGISGRKGALESHTYRELDPNTSVDGVGIFLFHMLLSEFKRKRYEQAESAPLSVLPHGYAYYAGGHPHFQEYRKSGNAIIAYPGPLFPNNFEELETLRAGGFYIVEGTQHGIETIEWIRIETRTVIPIHIDCDGMNPHRVHEAALNALNENLEDAIVLARFTGTLDGNSADIDWHAIYTHVRERGAYTYARNTHQLISAQQEAPEEVRGDVEETIIARFLESHEVPADFSNRALERLMAVLFDEKREGETRADFHARITQAFAREFEIAELDYEIAQTRR